MTTYLLMSYTYHLRRLIGVALLAAAIVVGVASIVSDLGASPDSNPREANEIVYK